MAIDLFADGELLLTKHVNICLKKTCSTTHTYICLLINGFKFHLDGPRTDTASAASIGSTHATPHPPQKGSGENATIEDI